MRRETRKVLEVLGIQQINNNNNNNNNMGSFSSNKKNEDDDQFLNKNHQKHENHYQEFQQEEITSILTLPTILTLGRVAAVPLLVTTFYMNGYWATKATTSIFIVAAITDWLDGYIARKMRLGTAFGAFLDPVADKLMVAATLVLLCTGTLEVAVFGEVPWLLPVPSVAIIGRERYAYTPHGLKTKIGVDMQLSDNNVGS